MGGLRTALYNFLYARKTGGKIVLRIEDTDQNRKVEGAVEGLLETFKAIGLEFDEGPVQGGDAGPYYQSQRLEIYREHIRKLLEAGHAYPCFCSSERLEKVRNERLEQKLNTPYDRECLKLSRDEAEKRMQTDQHVTRMRVPDDEAVVFYDLVRDEVSFETSEIDDQVLIKSDGFPTYHFANVVDDYLMGVSHVIRGEEWLTSTPKHVLLYRFLDWKQPKFAHLPLLLNPDRSKLSKRQGDVAVEDYLKKGYLPEALLNYIAMLGWSPGNDRELFSLEELQSAFSIKGIQKAGAVFDVEKLKWMNGHYLREQDISQIARVARPLFEEAGIDISDNKKYLMVLEDARKRISTLAEVLEFSTMFYKRPEYSEEDREILNTPGTQQLFAFWSDKLMEIDTLETEALKSLVQLSTQELGIKGKELYWPLRLALYGSVHGPDIPALVQILGVEEAIHRLKRHI